MSRDNENFRISVADELRRSMDPYSHSVTIIDENHRLIHDGMWFEVVQSSGSLAAGASVDVLLDVPAFVFPHLQELIVTTDVGPIGITIYEGTTVSANGTELATVNKNRNSANTAATKVYVAPTITDLGAVLKVAQIPAPAVAEIFSQSRGGEWVLKQGETYMIRLTNNDTGVADLNVTIGLYELDYPS